MHIGWVATKLNHNVFQACHHQIKISVCDTKSLSIPNIPSCRKMFKTQIKVGLQLSIDDQEKYM